MKTALIVVLALFAMAAAQGRRGPNGGGGVHVVDNAEGQDAPHPNIDPNFDSGFYRPSNPNPGYEPISNAPVYLDNNRPYQGKQYDNPNLRGGK